MKPNAPAPLAWALSTLASVVSAGTPQTLTFPDPGLQVVGNNPQLVATATSGLPVSFTSRTTAICRVSPEGVLTPLVEGTCSIDADQGGDPAHDPAPTVNATFDVAEVLLLEPDPVDPGLLNPDGSEEVSLLIPPGAPRMRNAVTTGFSTVTWSSGSYRCVAPEQDPGWCERNPYNPTVFGGAQRVEIRFDPPLENGGTSILDYTVTATGDNGHVCTATGASSPISIGTVSLLSPTEDVGLLQFGTTYTFTVRARSGMGEGASSAPSNRVPLRRVQGNANSLPEANEPVISSVRPSTGSTAGGQNVVLTGSRFAGALAVHIGGMPVQSYQVKGTDTIELVTAPGPLGKWDVLVVTPSRVGVSRASFEIVGTPRHLELLPLPSVAGIDTLLSMKTLSDGPVVYATRTARTCSVKATGEILLLDTGKCVLTAVALGDSVHLPSDTARSEIQVLPLNLAQTIDFPDPGPQGKGTSPVLVGSSSSGLSLTWTSNSPEVCAVSSSGRLSFSNIGTCVVTASRAGNGRYAAAASIQRSFAVTASPPSAPIVGKASARDGCAQVTFSTPVTDGWIGITGYRVVASTGGVSAEGVSSPITVTGLTNGTPYVFQVFALNAAGSSPASATSNPVVPQGTQSIEFPAPGMGTYGTAWKLPASASSGLPVRYSTSNPAALRISNDTAYPLAVDTATIVASQPGSTAFRSASEVRRNWSIGPKSISISGFQVADKVYDGTTSAQVTRASLSGVLESDDLLLVPGRASFLDPDAGTAKRVVLTGSALTGMDTSKYTLLPAGNGTGDSIQTVVQATIRPRPVVVVADDARKVAGEPDPALTYRATGLLGSDLLSGTLVRASGEDPGVYPISVGTLAAGGNYSISFTEGELTVEGRVTAIRARPGTAPRDGSVSARILRPVSAVATGGGRGHLDVGEADCGGESCPSVEVLLPGPATVSVRIFDRMGTPVIGWDGDLDHSQLRQIPKGSDGRFPVRLVWNLRAADGTPVGSGIYLWKVVALTQDGQKLETVLTTGVK